MYYFNPFIFNPRKFPSWNFKTVKQVFNGSIVDPFVMQTSIDEIWERWNIPERHMLPAGTLTSPAMGWEEIKSIFEGTYNLAQENFFF